MLSSTNALDNFAQWIFVGGAVIVLLLVATNGFKGWK